MGAPRSQLITLCVSDIIPPPEPAANSGKRRPCSSPGIRRRLAPGADKAIWPRPDIKNVLPAGIRRLIQITTSSIKPTQWPWVEVTSRERVQLEVRVKP